MTGQAQDAAFDHLGDEARAWYRYKMQGEQAARNELISKYAELVKYVAGQMAMGMPAMVQPADLETYGIFGLIDAMDRFDPKREIKFSTYAVTRIRGAILDGVRKMDWVPASLRRRAREITEAYRRLYKRNGRQATDEEMADYLGMSVEKFRDELAQVHATALMHLDDIIIDEEGGTAGRLVDQLPDDDAVDPFESAAWRDQKKMLAEAIRELSAQEQDVLTLYYYEGLTLTEIGHVLELSPSRISQIHSKAVLRLRGKLKVDSFLFNRPN